MDTSVIEVVQLPVIVEKMHQIKEEVEERTAKALSMECTEATLRDVKKERAELNKLYSLFEARRRDVKKQILAPYEAFEAVYKECISSPFNMADTELAGKINGVEDGLKGVKRDALNQYFAEYRESLGLRPDDAPFERARINVTMSASLKSLKAEAAAYLDRTAEDIAMIREQERADEIMTEYRRNGNAALAVMIVNQRHKEIEAERKRSEEDALVAQLLAKYDPSVDEALQEAAQREPDAAAEILMPPEEVPLTAPQDVSDADIYEVTFTVRGTIDQIRSLKKFLINGGFEYNE